MNSFTKNVQPMTGPLFVPEKFMDHFTDSFKLFKRKFFMSGSILETKP
jgi:hypothetical protein